MIKFSVHDNNKQFISVVSPGNIVVALVYIWRHAAAANIRFDHEELVAEIPESGFGFPLCDLRSTVPGSIVSTFCVDLDLPGQRYS